MCFLFFWLDGRLRWLSVVIVKMLDELRRTSPLPFRTRSGAFICYHFDFQEFVWRHCQHRTNQRWGKVSAVDGSQYLLLVPTLRGRGPIRVACAVDDARVEVVREVAGGLCFFNGGLRGAATHEEGHGVEEGEFCVAAIGGNGIHGVVMEVMVGIRASIIVGG